MKISNQRTLDGIYRLLWGPSDLQRWDSHINDSGKSNASERHRKLFETYKSQIEITARHAEETWDQEIMLQAKLLGSEKKAVREHWIEFPAGPAAQPDFIELIRMTWLRCDLLNKETPIYEAVAPEILLLKWLTEEIDLNSVSIKVLCCMPYWPLGLDDQNNWC